ncbi:sodium-dependent nutrient amino acid transporter 1-like [Macrobrachium rosenbergii]|uniref:sodium-dependent nutrient amino acid transporter 1-like n=1 Tax=Macrobrachium rosenbergii TaxID=79674 RepID=UPI0034D6BEBC
MEAGKMDPRGQWANPLEFLLSCVAMSVGLGNIWRFPFVALDNGGGAFLIPYILVLLFIGKPLYYMELCLGQFSSIGSVKVWELSPAFRGVGYGQAIAVFAITTYYVSLMGLFVYYMFASFSSVLPWDVCGNWSSVTCVDSKTNVTFMEENLGINASDLTSSTEEYFTRVVLNSDPFGLDNGIGLPSWKLTLCLFLSWVIIFVVLSKGIQSSGKAAYFTALFPYIVIFVMLIRGATLPGASKGIMYFITPRWEKLLEPHVWYSAVDQSFYSLTVGFGTIIMFSSFNAFSHNVYRDATIISITDTITSFLAGLTTFAMLGHLADILGVEVKDVLKGGGTSLAFVSYPDVLSRIKIAPQFFSVLFFFMLFTLGLGSSSALMGCIVTIITDDFPRFRRWIVTLVVCCLGFLVGLVYVTPQGQYVLTLVDHYGGSFILIIMVILEVIAVHWVYGVNNFCRDIEFMLNRKTGVYWKFCWALLIPVVLTLIFVYNQIISGPLKAGSYVFGPVANACGISIAVVACLMVPIFLVVEIVYRRRNSSSTLWEAVKDSFASTTEWCPKDAAIRQEYRQVLSSDPLILECHEVGH